MGTLMDNNSTFNIFRIAPSLAKLISALETKEYAFKIADYNAVVWDWDEKYPSFVGKVDESCYVLTTDKAKHPVYNDNICLSHKYDNHRDDDIICLGLNNYEHIYLPNNVAGKITFYSYLDNNKQRLIDLPYQDIIYEFIDILIEYKKTNNITDISNDEINRLLQEFLQKRNAMILKRKKNV